MMSVRTETQGAPVLYLPSYAQHINMIKLHTMSVSVIQNILTLLDFAMAHAVHSSSTMPLTPIISLILIELSLDSTYVGVSFTRSFGTPSA